MKTLAFGVALVIMAIGTVGVVVPSGLVLIAQHSLTSSAFYVIATVRVAFGLVLISVASVSRAPKTLRVLGYLILIAGITTALTGLAAIDRACVIIEWWSHQGSDVVRLTGVLILALGGFVAYACAPDRRGLTSAWSRHARRSCAIMSPRRAAHSHRQPSRLGDYLDVETKFVWCV